MNTFIAKLRVEGEQPFHLKHNESEEEGRMRRFTSVYPVILNELLFLRLEKKHNYTYLRFRGWDEKLQFDFDFFPLNFDLYYKLREGNPALPGARPLGFLAHCRVALLPR